MKIVNQLFFLLCITAAFHIPLTGAAQLAAHSQSYKQNREEKQELKASEQQDPQTLAAILDRFGKLPARAQTLIATFLIGDPDGNAHPITWRARTRRVEIEPDGFLDSPTEVTINSYGQTKFLTRNHNNNPVLLAFSSHYEPQEVQVSEEIDARECHINGDTLLTIKKGSEIARPFSYDQNPSIGVSAKHVEKTEGFRIKVWTGQSHLTNKPWTLVGENPVLILPTLKARESIEHKGAIGAYQEAVAVRCALNALEKKVFTEAIELPTFSNDDQITVPSIGNIGIIRRARSYALVRGIAALASGYVANNQTVHSVFLVGSNASKQALVVVATEPGNIELRQQMRPDEIKGAIIQLEPKICAQLAAPYRTVWSGLTPKELVYVHALVYDKTNQDVQLHQCVYDPHQYSPQFTQLIRARNEYLAPGVRFTATGSSPLGTATAWCTAHPTTGVHEGYWCVHNTLKSAKSLYNEFDLEALTSRLKLFQKPSNCLNRITFTWALCCLYELGKVKNEVQRCLDSDRKDRE